MANTTPTIKPDPVVNGKTFAQAIAGLTDRNQIGRIAQQYQNGGAAPTPIAVDNLGNSGNLMTPPPAATGAATAGLSGFLDSTTGAFKNAAKIDQTEINNESTDISNLIQSLGNTTALKDQAYVDAGVDTAKKRYDTATSQLEAEQNALGNTRDAILGNGAITREQAASNIAETERQSLSKQADIAIVQSAAARDYTTATSIADRAVEAKLEPMKARLDAMKFLFENNKDQFTKEDERAYDKEKMKYASQLSIEEYKAKSKIDQAALGDPLYTPQAPSTITIAAGQDPYDIATQQLGIPIDQFKALNPQITDWNNIKPGTKLNVPTTNLQGKQDAINTILGSAKFTKDQKADFIRAINSGQDPLTVAKNQAKNIAGQTEATKITGFEVAKSQLQDIQSLLAQYYANGGKTDIFSGNYEKSINKLGEVQDPKLVSIATQIATALQIYRNAVTGTAYSVQEGKSIEAIFPGINKTQGLNTAILNGRMAAFDSTIDGSYRSVLGSAYDQLKGTPSGTGTYNGVQIPGLTGFTFAGVTFK